MSTTRPRARAHDIFTLRRATATTTATTAMTMTNIDNEALCASARHFHILSCNGDNDNNDRRRQNDECQMTRPRARAHNIFTSRRAMATTTMATKTTNDKDDEVIDEALYARARHISHCAQAHMLRVKHRRPRAQAHQAFSHHAQAYKLQRHT